MNDELMFLDGCLVSLTEDHSEQKEKEASKDEARLIMSCIDASRLLMQATTWRRFHRLRFATGIRQFHHLACIAPGRATQKPAMLLLQPKTDRSNHSTQRDHAASPRRRSWKL